MKGYVTIDEGFTRPQDAVPIVSVIVPVYNTERYLDQALDSLEDQTLHSIEILCINDGSTDGSLAIMRKHARHDARIRVIDKPNGGYGSACNRGLEEASGTWIALLEPDDWIEPDMFKELVDFAASFNQNIDIVKSAYWRIWRPDSPRQVKLHCSYHRQVKPSDQPFRITDPGASCLLGYHPSIWSALYRRSFLQEFAITFPEYPGAGWADNPFLVETLGQARSIAYLDKPFYCYREDTYEKLAAFAQRNVSLPLERWHTMLDILERIGLADNEVVMREHTRRGFTYLNGIAQELDLNDSETRSMLKDLFDRMDDHLVFSDQQRISPFWKRTYAEIKGVEVPPISELRYMTALVREGLSDVIRNGPKNALYRTNNYLVRNGHDTIKL